MSDRGESEEAFAAESQVTAVPRPAPEASSANVARCRPVAADDGGQSDGIGAPRPSELGGESRRPVGGG